MSSSTPATPTITPYERAVCYYTLPKVIHPVTFGIIIVYALCVLEAIGAFAYGIYAKDMQWTTIGSYAFAGIVAFGLIVFFVRALLNDVRQRKALAEARSSPMHTPAEDVPDPFADHVLLKHPIHAQGTLFDCSSGDDSRRYIVEHRPNSREWIARAPDGAELFTVRVLSGVSSFSFSMGGRPKLLGVFKEGTEIARILRRGGLMETVTEITSETLSPKFLTIRSRGIYIGGALRGRIYDLRGNDYLDVHREALNDALLGYFITIT